MQYSKLSESNRSHPAQFLSPAVGWRLTTVLLAGLVAAVAPAGEFNQVLSIGDVAPEWKDLPGIDGQSHSWEDVREAPAVVVVFTSNTCPYAVDVEDRLIALHKQFAGRGVAVVAINSNTAEADRLPAMRERAEEKKFRFPYLDDASQELARQFGATTTPEFFVIDGDREVVYMGSLDDSPDGSSVSERYVETAIDAVLSGEAPETAETVPIGCRIRFKRTSRGR